MIEYIKMILLSLICGATFALPVSSSAHYSFLNTVMNFSEDVKVLGFYYSVASLGFSLVIFFLLRKIYSLGFKSLFDKDKKLTNYRRLMKNLLISLAPMAVLFIPVGEGKLVCDLFDGFLSAENLLLVSVASIVCGLILVISMWYTKQSYSVTKRGADTKTVIRTSVYQLVSHIIPGISRVATAGTNMLICDVESKVVIREIYLYIAPQMLLVNAVKIIRYALSDMIINPVMIIFALAITVIMSSLVVTKMSKINFRRLFAFFSAYCIVTGVIFAVLSFVLK